MIHYLEKEKKARKEKKNKMNPMSRQKGKYPSRSSGVKAKK
jgi:hypothetical protein